MPKRWKTVFALKIPACRARQAPELDTVEIADRLDTVASELAIIDAAIGGSEVEGRERFGFYSILHRQIDEITTLRDAVHQPRAKRRA